MDQKVNVRVIAFDPGISTGFAYFEDGELKDWHVLNSVRQVVENLYGTCHDNAISTIVVMESFNRGNTVVDEQIQTLECCGAIVGICELLCLPLERQAPSVRKSYIPLAKQMIGDSILPGKNHTIDAIAHGIRYMERHGIDWNKYFWMRQAFPLEGLS